MACSPTQILSNRKNALRSTGPKTEEGKARSRANSYKHGLTGAGIVLPEEDVAEVERRTKDLRDEMNPLSTTGELLVCQIATLSVRMNAPPSTRPPHCPSGSARSWRSSKSRRASTPRRPRSSGSRRAGPPCSTPRSRRAWRGGARPPPVGGFFRVLDDLRWIKKEAKAADPVAVAQASRESLGSILSAKELGRQFDAIQAELAEVGRSRPSRPVPPADFPPLGGRFDVPMTIGKRRWGVREAPKMGKRAEPGRLAIGPRAGNPHAAWPTTDAPTARQIGPRRPGSIAEIRLFADRSLV